MIINGTITNAITSNPTTKDLDMSWIDMRIKAVKNDNATTLINIHVALERSTMCLE